MWKEFTEMVIEAISAQVENEAKYIVFFICLFVGLFNIQYQHFLEFVR